MAQLIIPNMPQVGSASTGVLADPSAAAAPYRAMQNAGLAIQDASATGLYVQRSRQESKRRLAEAQAKLAEERRKLQENAFRMDFKTRQIAMEGAIAEFEADPANTARDVESFAAKAWSRREAELEKSLVGGDPSFAKEIKSEFVHEAATFNARLGPRVIKKQVAEQNSRALHLMREAHRAGRDEDFAAAVSMLNMAEHEKRERVSEVLREGAYQEVSDMIDDALYANDADGLKGLADRLSDDSGGDYEFLPKNSRGQLALRAQSAWRRIELAQRQRFRSFVQQVAKTGELDMEAMAERLKAGEITEEQSDVVLGMAPGAKEAIEEKARYERDTKGVAYRQYRKATFERLFEKHVKGANVGIKRERSDEILAEIEALPLGRFAKADLYAEHLQTLSMAAQEGDGWWGPLFDNEFAENLTEPQRAFAADYLDTLAQVIVDARPDMDLGAALSRDLVRIETILESEKAPQTEEDFAQLKARLLEPYLRSAVSTRLRQETAPVVRTQEDFDALPSGAVFIEDGKRYRKP